MFLLVSIKSVFDLNKNSKILVVREQGIGDELRFLSLIERIEIGAGKIIIETDKTNQDSNVKSDNGYDIQEKPKSEIQIVTPQADTAVVNELMNDLENAGTSDDEGFFVDSFPVANKYNQQITRTGRIATFKSTSGWTDKKYFVLMNDLPIGTIVRITNLDNNRSICAKVIGVLPAIKSNNNLLIRVSSATAHTLKITDKIITVTVGFYK